MPHYFDVFLSPVRDNQAAQVLIVALFIGIAADVVIGLAGAALRHEVQSSKMREGIQHKIAEFGLLLAADVIDGMLAGGLKIGTSPVLVSTTLFLALMELFSICENCIKLNPDFTEVPIIGVVARLLNEAKGNADRGGADA